MISLYVNNGVAYVWNSDDWHVLRSEYRICGSLMGSIATYPRQNDFLGMPMALTSEETALLIEKGVCKLLELTNISEKPSQEEKEKFKTCQERIIEQQADAMRKRRIETLSQKIDIIVAGKKQKLLSKGVTNVELDKDALLQEEINKLPKIAPAHLLVHLPTEHYRKSDERTVSVNKLEPSVVDKNGEFRLSVFRDLWEKGLTITSGLKFGCDYLVYPGDPSRFHALYMVRCIEGIDKAFHPSYIVAFGRLSVAVNKLAVFAFRKRCGNIDYQTLQWHDSLNVI